MQRWKFRIPMRPLVALPWLGRAPYYCFHMISTDALVSVGLEQRRVSHLQTGMKVFLFHWVLCNCLEGRRRIILQWDNSKNLGSHLVMILGSLDRALHQALYSACSLLSLFLCPSPTLLSISKINKSF